MALSSADRSKRGLATDRIRRVGGGRKRLEHGDLGLERALERIKALYSRGAKLIGRASRPKV
jgi:hypothetical protein